MKINPNLSFLAEQFNKNINGVCLEGSSRSGKSFSIIFFLVLFSEHKKGFTINIIRETYASFKTTLYADFHKVLNDFGIENPFGTVQDIHQFNLLGNTLNFLGADKPDKFEGAGSDIIWFNEMLDIPKQAFDNLTQRCRKFWVADWNPKFTDHWAFELEKREEVKFLRTTYKDNPFISANERLTIEGYCLYEFEDLTIPIDQRRPNKKNYERGTVDKFRWSVYGEGERSACDGLIFNNVNYCNEIPADVDQISYGIDFGETAQTAIIKSGVRISDGRKDLYLQKLWYMPADNIDIIIEVVKKLGIDKHIWCDNNKPEWINDMRRANINAVATRKFPGSREYWITTIKRFNVNIVRDTDFRKEQENFTYRVVDGIQLSETIKKFDHLWSASGYSVVGDFLGYLS